jgi:hypothetical protein
VIGDLLHEVSSSVPTGRVEVFQSPALKGMSILAQLLLTHQDSSNPNYIDEEISMPSASGSKNLRGVADGADGVILIAITSLSNSNQHMTVECLFEKGQVFSKPLVLLPGETLVTEACVAKTTHGAVFKAVQEGAVKGPRGPVGISLTTDAIPGSFAAFGLVPHEDRGSTFFSGIVFDDPKMLVSSTTVLTGVPVGRTNLLPGNFIPELAVANFSTKDANVRVQYAHNSGESTALAEVTDIIIPARSSTNVVLENLRGSPELKNSFVLVSDAAPGDIIFKLVSKSDSALREVELLGKDGQERENGGSHPWTLEGETESTLLLFNHTSETQTVDVFLSRPGNLWLKAYHLLPLQTEVISFRRLLQDQVKDDKGRTLPRNILTGQVGWFAHGVGKVTSRILQSNRALAMARNFSCTESYSLAGAQVTTDTTTMDAGDTVSFGSVLGFVSIPVGGELGGCGGDPSVQGGSYSISWSSDDSSIASISGSSSQSNVNVKGMKGGQTLVSATLTDSNFGCTASDGATATVKPKVTEISPAIGLVGTSVQVTIKGSGFGSTPTVAVTGSITVSNPQVNAQGTQIIATFTPANASSAGGNQSVMVTVNGQTSVGVNFFVQVPTNFDASNVIQDNDPTDTACPAGSQGFFGIVNYQLTDQNGSPIQVAGLTPQEHFTVNGTPAFSGFRPFATPGTTPASGAFQDKPVGSCITVVQGQNLCANVVQTFNALVPTSGSPGSSVTYPITTQTTRRDCQQGIKVIVNPGSTFTLGTVN